MALSPVSPSWVKEILVDTAQPAPTEGLSEGVYYLLSDEQSNVDTQTLHKHFALRLISAEGVENYSTINVSFDGEHQSIVWHKLQIIRNGSHIDLLEDQQFRFASNQDRDSQIYDQRVSCTVIVEGTRKGDVIEYAYSITGANPVVGGRFTHWFSLNYYVPVARTFVRVVREADGRALNLKIVSSEGSSVQVPEAQRTRSGIAYEIDRRNVPAVYMDGDVPSEYTPYTYLIVSDWESWQEVSRWGADLFHYEELAAELPEDLRRALVKWKQLDSQEKKVLAALRWVQEEIRYVGIMVGPHNYKPYPLSDTLDRAFGDCKDKTQLLCFLLKQLGIDAAPTMVESDYGHALPNYLPSAASFDHVITRVVVGGREYWLDPTNSSQGGSLETLWHADYGWGLVLTHEGETLREVSGQGADVSRSFIRERYTMDTYNGDVLLEVETRYTGLVADSQRRYFQRNDQREIERGYLNFYAQQFPDISQSESIQYIDDLSRNVVEVQEHYRIRNSWVANEANAAESYLYTYPELIRGSTFLSDTRIRSMPAVQSYPLHFTQLVEVVLPEPGNFEDESHLVETPWFRFENTVTTDANTLSILYDFRNLTRVIPASDYPEYAKKLDEVIDLLGYSIAYIDPELIGTSDGGALGNPHLASFMSLLLGLFSGGILLIYLVRKKCVPPKPEINPELDGISGWLVLPTIGIVLSPFTLLFGLVEQRDYYSAAWVDTYTNSANSTYIMGFEWLLLGEIVAGVILFCISITMVWVYFKKRAIARPLYIVFSVAALLVIWGVTGLSNYLLVESGFDKLEADGSSVRAVVQLIIWGSYFAVSERAESTFRH
ncbi:MAG: hypothetical protein ACI9ZV_000512 [Candidatus Azotimanducaceae bacterium]|jgi:hypothetical protein